MISCLLDGLQYLVVNFLSQDSKIGANLAYAWTGGRICISWQSGKCTFRHNFMSFPSCPIRLQHITVGSPWTSSAGSVTPVYKNLNLEELHLSHCMSTMGRGTPSNGDVTLNLILRTLFLPGTQCCTYWNQAQGMAFRVAPSARRCQSHSRVTWQRTGSEY